MDLADYRHGFTPLIRTMWASRALLKTLTRHLGAAAAILTTLTAPVQATPPHKLLVISVDGLDWRYLRDRDKLFLKIPNIRRFMAIGETADGVIGVWPTITWPSHTSIVTGLRPDQHGILGNARRGSDFTESYWSVKSLRARTLWDCANAAGLSTASITWPVTLNAPITYNLPEVSVRRNGGSMDLDSIAANATPGLVAAITARFPSFPQQWVDDRTRSQAAIYLLAEKQPDLLLLHLVDLDSEEHDQGPFTANAAAILERTDELIGLILSATPGSYDAVLTSDHGFERVDRIVNPTALLARAKLTGEIRAMGGIAFTSDPAVAAYLRTLVGTTGADIGREIPKGELDQYAPALVDVLAAFEPADHVMFGGQSGGPYETKPQEKGEHGFWPLRHDYRSVFILEGPGVRPGTLPELQMISLESRLATQLGLSCKTPAETRAREPSRSLTGSDAAK